MADDLGLGDFHVEIDAWFFEHSRARQPVEAGKPQTPRAPRRPLPTLPDRPKLADGTGDSRRPFPARCRPLFPADATGDEKAMQDSIARAGKLGAFGPTFRMRIGLIEHVCMPDVVLALNEYLVDWKSRAVELAKGRPVFDASTLAAALRVVVGEATRRILEGLARYGELQRVVGPLTPIEKPWRIRLDHDGQRVIVMEARWEAWSSRRPKSEP